jgi:hypothetical protein
VTLTAYNFPLKPQIYLSQGSYVHCCDSESAYSMRGGMALHEEYRVCFKTSQVCLETEFCSIYLVIRDCNQSENAYNICSHLLKIKIELNL